MNTDQILAYDTDGQLLCAIDPGAAEKAIARREAVRLPHGGIRLRANQPMAPLSGSARRRLYLAKHGH